MEHASARFNSRPSRIVGAAGTPTHAESRRQARDLGVRTARGGEGPRL
ncbi:hypothetical protein GS506_06245 [Rhodococcus hoagii]|nr:hypothetical protein [Prescottella equi]